ncbi:MAG: tautomerase family protein [Campylobacterales bacterium]
MPYIEVKVAGSLNDDQKREIAKSFSETMERVAGKPKAASYIVFSEVDRKNWAKGDNILADLDRKNG